MIITPISTEKSYKLADNNIYVFRVPLNANKAEVLRQLKADYPETKIADVRLMVVKGKPKHYVRGKRAGYGKTYLVDTKKAYVTVLEGTFGNYKGESVKVAEDKAEIAKEKETK